MKIIKLIFCIFLLYTIVTFAKEIMLFDKEGFQKNKYDSFIKNENLVIEDELIFNDGEKYIFKSVLGKGKTTKVLEVIDSTDGLTYALRLPLKLVNINMVYAPYIDYTFLGYAQLKEMEVHIPRIYKYLKSSYVLVEKIDYKFDYKKFLARPDLIDKKELKEAEIAFYEFAEQVAGFKKIGDFHPGQLVYNEFKKRWYIMDWVNNHELIFNKNDDIPFGHLFFDNLLIEFDDDMKPIKEFCMFKGEKLKERERSDREKRIIKELNNRIMKQRDKIRNSEDEYLLKFERKIEAIKTEKDLIKLVDERPRPYTLYLRRRMMVQFEKYQKLFSDQKISFKNILKLKSILVETDSDLLIFVKTFKNQLKSISDLYKLTRYKGEQINQIVVQFMRDIVDEEVLRILNFDKGLHLTREILDKVDNNIYFTYDTKNILNSMLKLAKSNFCHDLLMKIFK